MAINLANLTQDDIGRKVIYQDPRIADRREEGELTSWNHRYVFVRFRGPGGEACSPEEVSFSLPH